MAVGGTIGEHYTLALTCFIIYLMLRVTLKDKLNANPTKGCVYCNVSIHEDARQCMHCNTRQPDVALEAFQKGATDGKEM